MKPDEQAIILQLWGSMNPAQREHAMKRLTPARKRMLTRLVEKDSLELEHRIVTAAVDDLLRKAPPFEPVVPEWDSGS